MSDLYVPRLARIVRTEQFTPTEMFFEVEMADGAFEGCPGQFVLVGLAGVGEAPISLSSLPHDGNRFDLCIRRMGGLTSALHRLAPGAYVGIRGPFGAAFPVQEYAGRRIVVVAGGLGIIPLRSLIQHLRQTRRLYEDVTILYGARTPSDLLYHDELYEMHLKRDVRLLVTVDAAPASDWVGNVGPVTALFRRLEFDPRHTIVAIVGPPVMFKHVLQEVMARGVPESAIWVSLERRMRCGVGKCGHCQINELYVCRDGPVFALPDIRDKTEAL